VVASEVASFAAKTKPAEAGLAVTGVLKVGEFAVTSSGAEAGAAVTVPTDADGAPAANENEAAAG
jgi:hypothetical protein